MGRPSRLRWTLRLLTLGAVAALLGLLTWALLEGRRGESLVGRIAAGEAPAAPGFELSVLWSRAGTWPSPLVPALDDQTLGIAELRGRPAVLNFWASWCLPCRDEAPLLNASAREHSGTVAFVGVNVQDLRPDALGFLRDFQPPYAAVRDRGNGAYDDYGLTGVPETYYVDARGRIVAHTPGPVTERTLERGVAAALRAARE